MACSVPIARPRTVFEQALTHLPETRETLEQAIDLRFDPRNAGFPLAEWRRIEGYLREAEIPARRLDDQRRLGWVSAHMSSYYQLSLWPSTTFSWLVTSRATIAERHTTVGD